MLGTGENNSFSVLTCMEPVALCSVLGSPVQEGSGTDWGQLGKVPPAQWRDWRASLMREVRAGLISASQEDAWGNLGHVC